MWQSQSDWLLLDLQPGFNIRDSSTVIRSRGKRERVEEHYRLTIGFILDGVDDFENLTMASSYELRKQASQVIVVDPPIMTDWGSKPRIYNPNDEHAHVSIEVLHTCKHN